MLLRVNLELESYRVLEAANAADVRGALGQEDVALVLLDVRLGEDNGIELARELRGTHPELPIAFLTGSTIAPSEEAHQVGDAVVQKPFELDELSETVARLTQR